MSYFRDVANAPPRLFDHLDASFGQCLGQVPGINASDIESKWGFESPWRLPAFAHKSSTGNECFSQDVSRQLRWANGERVNICHLNPLAALWRDAFCQAVVAIGTSTPQVAEFCDDGAWYSPLPVGP